MTRVIVHRLPGRKKAFEACRLVEGLYLTGRRVIVWLDDRSRATLFDEYLWTFTEHSFVPHALWLEGDPSDEERVLIATTSLVRPRGFDVAVVLDRVTELSAAGGFEEIHDFVTAAPEDEDCVEFWQASGFEVGVVNGVEVPAQDPRGGGRET